MSFDTDILIVGGGLNGTALALALAQVGFDSVIVDAMPVDARKDAAFDGRGYALALTSQRMLRTLGVWDAVAADSQPILDIKVSDGRPGEGASPYFVHFDHTEIEEGPMGHMIEDRFLRRALLDGIVAAGHVTHLAGASVVAHDVDAGGVTITLKDGRTLRGRMLVGCDGRQSAVAQRSGIRRIGWQYAQSSLVCAVEHDLPHQGCAHQLFMPAGPLAILPLPGNRSSIVWTETADRADVIHGLSDAEYLACLRPCFGEFLGDVSLAGERFKYPLGLSLAQSFVADRVALVGDAAHGIHPLAGQGLNLGLRDVAALAEVLADAARRGQDIGSLTALQPYEQWRRFDTAALAVATDGINRVFSNDNPLLRGLRDLALGAANAAPTVRRTMIRQAAGLTGDLPRLMQGRAI
ncbi:FAD-dependent monooxygenase [Amylibacter sp. IMCC11727]|uniref:FAD-dependent monooxygenase n=1 Tax=Amylibacter sp. IMCC11727 TaxID=3039851 RepID=UPI00244DC4EE|nr:FAD-dependent monooxygenase [Amylibacter sp. IMCC11727]WGI23598.1 FAD-dependent monooxygenase [Amylibacter sp. IMCC11727]